MKTPNQIYVQYIPKDVSFQNWITVEKQVFVEKKNSTNREQFLKYLNTKYNLHKERAWLNADGKPKFWDKLKDVILKAADVLEGAKKPIDPANDPPPEDDKILGMKPIVAYPVIGVGSVLAIYGIFRFIKYLVK